MILDRFDIDDDSAMHYNRNDMIFLVVIALN